MPIIYPPLSTPAPRRLELFKREASQGKWVRPRTWRDVRFATLRSPCGMSQGFNGEGRHRVPVWSSHDAGEQFRNERFCDEVEGVRMEHTGYYTDTHRVDLVRGIVASLPHGRFIAGYHMTGNGERVYFADLHTDEKDAARMADEHARVVGEAEVAHAQRFDEAQTLEGTLETSLMRLRECIALRHTACMDYVREEIAELVQTIRDTRETLRTDYAGVL